MNKPLPTASILTREDGTSIAYHYTPGKNPGIIFLPGFKSDMNGTKAQNLEIFCNQRGNAFLRFDYQGHGQSSGNFNDGTIGDWASDAIEAMDRLTKGPQVLVGSSMGSWIMLLIARARPERIAGLLGLASAPDFTEDLVQKKLSDLEQIQLEKNGYLLIHNKYDPESPYRINKRLLDDGREQLVLQEPLEINVPVRLIHGIKDQEVPWSKSTRIMEIVTSNDIEITLVKAGEHRLSEKVDLERMRELLNTLLDQLEKSES